MLPWRLAGKPGALMHHLLIVLLIVLYSSGLAAESAEPPRPLLWAKNHAPPFYVNEGGSQGEGFADGVQALLEQALPQYQHRSVDMPLPRLNDFWHKGDNFCFASMIHKPLPHESRYVLSNPNVFYLPHGVITRRNFSLIEGNNQIPLQSLLTRPDLVLGTVGSRSFGITIDNLMLQHEDSTRRFVRRDHDGLQSLLNMLLLGRVDYIIDYAFVFHHYQPQPQFRQKLAFTPLTETRGEGILGAIGCTNNEWGRAVIADINVALAQLMQHPRYRTFVARWQGIGMNQQQYWQAFDDQARSSHSQMKRDRP